jgi:hypothetical protein
MISFKKHYGDLASLSGAMFTVTIRGDACAVRCFGDSVPCGGRAGDGGATNFIVGV